jgi:hypothetical protein
MAMSSEQFSHGCRRSRDAIHGLRSARKCRVWIIQHVG